jgi:hypothetical protein
MIRKCFSRPPACSGSAHSQTAKKNLVVFIVATLAAIAPLLVSSQQTETGPDMGSVQPEEPISTDRQIPYLLVDRITWDVSDPFNQDTDLASLNTPEAKWARYKAALAFEAPVEYAKQYPPTAEQVVEMEIAAEAIENPISLTDYLQLPRSPEEQQALLDSFIEPAPGSQDASQP